MLEYLIGIDADMGIIAQKFAEKGIRPRDVEFDIAIAKFENNGGTYDQAIARVRAAYRMGSEGQSILADEACDYLPSSPHTHAAKGQTTRAGQAKTALPDAAPHGTGEGRTVAAPRASIFLPASVPTESSEGGQRGNADKAMFFLPPSAAHGDLSCARPKPVLVHRSITPADLRAMADTKKQAAITIMETLKIDGRPIGDWTIGEALHVGRDKLCNGHILVAVARHYANADHNALVRDVIKVADLQRIIQKAAEAVDAG